MRKQLLKRAENIEECKSCDYQKLCGGGCMRNAYTFNGNVFGKDPYCSTYKELFSSFSDFIHIIELKGGENGKN
mgnify:CR=1 FL=1